MTRKRAGTRAGLHRNEQEQSVPYRAVFAFHLHHGYKASFAVEKREVFVFKTAPIDGLPSMDSMIASKPTTSHCSRMSMHSSTLLQVTFKDPLGKHPVESTALVV